MYTIKIEVVLCSTHSSVSRSRSNFLEEFKVETRRDETRYQTNKKIANTMCNIIHTQEGFLFLNILCYISLGPWFDTTSK